MNGEGGFAGPLFGISDMLLVDAMVFCPRNDVDWPIVLNCRSLLDP
jgi:hypothetical protein